MGANSVQRIQDSVHGLMEFRGQETLAVEVLRTPELQRLRRVRQLGLVHYVFPGAEHSRLSHSIGASHLAVRFGRQLQNEAKKMFARHLVPDEHAITDFALAALCHDMGHGPLSHAWEREIVSDSFDRTKWAKTLGLDPNEEFVKKAKWHELVGQGLLAWPDGQLHRLLIKHEHDTPERIRKLLAGQYYIPYLGRLLNSDVDVDRADFIMRDTHNTGVAYGRFDLNWLISTCTLGKTEAGQLVAGFDERKAVRVIEQFLIARRAMYDTVYHHKTVRCMEGMVALLLRRLRAIAMEDKIHMAPLVEPIVKIMKGEALPPEELLKLDDFSLSVLIDSVANGDFKDDTAQDLARRLQARDLFKLVPVHSQQIVNFLAVPGNTDRLSETVKRFVPGHPDYYIHIDQTEFRMLSSKSAQQVMLVDGDHGAVTASDHSAFAS